MKKLLFIVACLTGLSCGKSNLDFAQPAEGQVFSLDQQGQGAGFQYVDFVVVNNEFEGISIEFRGAESVAQEVQCPNTNNAPLARCQRPAGQVNFSGGQSCSQQAPCVVTAIMKKGDQIVAVRSIRFTRGTAAK